MNSVSVIDWFPEQAACQLSGDENLYGGYRVLSRTSLATAALTRGLRNIGEELDVLTGPRLNLKSRHILVKNQVDSTAGRYRSQFR